MCGVPVVKKRVENVSETNCFCYCFFFCCCVHTYRSRFMLLSCCVYRFLLRGPPSRDLGFGWGEEAKQKATNRAHMKSGLVECSAGWPHTHTPTKRWSPPSTGVFLAWLLLHSAASFGLALLSHAARETSSKYAHPPHSHTRLGPENSPGLWLCTRKGIAKKRTMPSFTRLTVNKKS